MPCNAKQCWGWMLNTFQNYDHTYYTYFHKMKPLWCEGGFTVWHHGHNFCPTKKKFTILESPCKVLGHLLIAFFQFLNYLFKKLLCMFKRHFWDISIFQRQGDPGNLYNYFSFYFLSFILFILVTSSVYSAEFL